MAQEEEIVLNVKSDIGKVVEQTEKLEGAAKKGQKGFKGIGTAIKGVGTAIKAQGIGIIVGLLAKLMEVFSSNQKVVDTFKTTMTTLSIAFNDLFSYLDNNYETIKGYLKGLFTDPLGELAKLGMGIEKFFIEKMKGAAQVLKGVATIMANLTNPKKMLEGMAQLSVGVVTAGKEIAEIYKDIESGVSDYISSTIDQAKGITAVTNAAQLAAVTFAELNAQFLKDAEIQRQIRDDETKTFAERIEANNKLSEILAEQQELQREQIQISIDAAQAQFNINDSVENELALKEEKVRMLELEETITGQLSEQKTNAVALEKELLESQRELRAEGMSGLERELQELKDAYELKLKMAKKSGSDTTKITKLYEGQKKAIVQANVNEQIEAYATLANALIGLAGESKELAIASAVIDTFVGANKAMSSAPPPLNFVMAATVIAGGLANVRTIMQTDVPGGGGGGGGISAPAPPAPQMMSGAFDLSGGVEPEATKAYVVTDEMTNSQNQLANIRRRATI